MPSPSENRTRLKVIGFDTATDETVVGATVSGEPVWEVSIGPDPSGRPTHSGELLEAISTGVDQLGGWGEVDRIAVGTGPGTFTGLRIGLATAIGLAAGAAVPLAGVSTLGALSLALQPGPGESSAPVLDARRGEVFFAAWDSDGRNLVPPSVGDPAEAAQALIELDLTPLAFGPGAVRFREKFLEAGVVPLTESDGHGPLQLTGTSICHLGEQAEELETGAIPEPQYLRRPDAELWLERDSGQR